MSHHRCCCGNPCCTGGRPCVLPAGGTPPPFVVSGSSSLALTLMDGFGAVVSHTSSPTTPVDAPTGLTECTEVYTVDGDDVAGFATIEDDAFTTGGITKTVLTKVRVVYGTAAITVLWEQFVQIDSLAGGSPAYTVNGQLSVGFTIGLTAGAAPCVTDSSASLSWNVILDGLPAGIVGGNGSTNPSVNVGVTGASQCPTAVSFSVRGGALDGLGQVALIANSNITITLDEAEACSAGELENTCLGACCDGGTCSELTAEECETAGGLFQGQGTICDESPCQPGGADPGCCETDCCRNVGTVEVDWGIALEITHRVCCDNVITACPTVYYSNAGTESISPSGDCDTISWSHSLPSIQVEFLACCAASPHETYLNSNSVQGDFRCLDGFEYGGMDAPLAGISVSLASLFMAAYESDCNSVETDQTFDFNDETCGISPSVDYKAFTVRAVMYAYAFGRGDCGLILPRGAALRAGGERGSIIGRDRDVLDGSGDRAGVLDGDRGGDGGGAHAPGGRAVRVDPRSHPGTRAPADRRSARARLHQVRLVLVRWRDRLLGGDPGGGRRGARVGLRRAAAGVGPHAGGAVGQGDQVRGQVPQR